MRLGPVVIGRDRGVDTSSFVPVTEPAPMPTLREVLNEHDLIDVTPNGVVIVGPKGSVHLDEDTTGVAPGAVPDLRELGSSGRNPYKRFATEEYLPELQGYSGIRKFDSMRRSDGQIRATLRLVKTPVLSARWYMEPFSDSDFDQKVADHIWKNLTQWSSMSWPQFLHECLLHVDFGHYAFEKVFDFKMVEGERRVIWRKFAPRHPLDIVRWVYDAQGGPRGGYFYSEDAPNNEQWIPINKLLVFVHDREAGSLEGISVLRSAYKHFYFKDVLYKIDAIQKERHGIGVPIIKLPLNFTPQDKTLADQIGRNLRTNEKAHVVLPPMWEIMFAKLEGQPVNAMESIEHHDVMIARNILGQFINNPAGTSQEEQQQLFLKSTRFIADQVRDVLNKWAIPELVDYNWKVDGYPELKVRRIGDTVDWRTISFAIRNFVGAGLLIPDDWLENWIRSEMDLPKPDKSSQRIIIAPQLPGTIPDGQPDANPGPGGPAAGAAHQNQGVGSKPTPPNPGLPRQSTAGNQRIGTGSGATGRDGGGK